MQEIDCMTRTAKAATIAEDAVISRIYLIRKQKVLLDKDLAEIYGVKAIRLREQVKRNRKRFPDHFMFQLTAREVEMMVSQNAIPSRKQNGWLSSICFY